MKKFLLVIIALFVLVLLVRALREPERSTAQITASSERALATDVGGRAPGVALVEGQREQRFESGRDLPPRLSLSERPPAVALDRGPRRPNEHPDRYRDRIWFAKHFDAFVRESGATDAQVQRLLLAIYDFTAHRTYLWDILRHEIRESGQMDEDRVLELLGDSLRQLAQAEQRILTGPQLSIYHDHCGYCAQRLATAEYDEPVLQVKLTDEEGR